LFYYYSILTFLVNIISLNVNGLRSYSKIQNVLSLFDEWKIDVLLLQETHWDESIISYAKKIWQGEIFYCNLSTSSCGVAILVSTNWKNKVSLAHTDNKGRFISVTLHVDDIILNVANTYLPNSSYEKIEYLKSIYGFLKYDNMIIGGDFNTTFSSIDRYNTVHKNDQSYTVLNKLITNYQLCDIWRKRYPSSNTYSWKRIIDNKLKMSRIDFFLISENLKKFVNHIYYKETTFSDHSFVSMRMNFNKIERGPGVWILNNLILDETEYNKKILEIIEQEKYCPLYKSELLVWWDNLKYKIKKYSQLYSKKRSNEKNKKYNIVQNKLQNIQKQAIIDVLKYESLKKELEDIELEKCKGAILRSKAFWAVESDKNTKYFLNLESYKQRKNNISELLVENDEIVSDTDSILDYEFKFYSELYSCVDVKNKDIDSFLNGINNSLTDIDRKLCDQIITMDEIFQALSKMKKNKTPGSDGIAVEFYLKFWNNLGNDLQRSMYGKIHETGSHYTST